MQILYPSVHFLCKLKNLSDIEKLFTSFKNYIYWKQTCSTRTFCIINKLNTYLKKICANANILILFTKIVIVTIEILFKIQNRK